MEPVRTKRCVVLAMVFAMAGSIMLGCDNRGGEKRAEIAAEKPVVKPDATPVEEPRVKPDAAATVKSKEPKTDAAAPQLEGGEPEENDDFDFDMPEEETAEETARRLGPPLVDQPEKLVRLDKVDSIWLDKSTGLDGTGGRLVMVGEVCQRRAPLEMFVCLWHTKEHEAVLTTRIPAKAAHAGLLALGAKVGRPVQFMPKYVPASGSIVDIEVIWKDKDGKIQKSRGQDWVRNFQTKKPMQRDWVFAGSGFWRDEKTGKKYYQAESGDFICVSNFSTAMLDLPIKSSQQNEALLFEAFTERIPPLGTPVTIVLKPRLGKKQ